MAMDESPLPLELSSNEVGAYLAEIDRIVKKPIRCHNFTEEWRNLPEVPTRQEILPPDSEKVTLLTEEWNAYQQDSTYGSPDLPHNKLDGAWPSTAEFLKFQYKVNREDAIAPLRSSVQHFRAQSSQNEDSETYIYDSVHLVGLTKAPGGIAFRISFSTARSGKNIRWDQSKRLQQGTIVALSTTRDMFGSMCKIATVAARPIEGGLDQNPPQIDIFFGHTDDAVFDPSESYIMLEARGGYFEASRHVLRGIQEVADERFQLQKYIVSLDNNIDVPTHRKLNPYMNLTSLENSSPSSLNQQMENFDILEGFPELLNSKMDSSQIQACEGMLKQALAIVQGPPGTGKTFTSIAAIKALIDNTDDRVIVIAAQTNHAVDQLLNQVMSFYDNVIRLGGRTDRKNIDISLRTLYELRQTHPNVPKGSHGIKMAKKALELKGNKIQAILATLFTEEIIGDDMLLEYGCITQAQRDSLYEEGWVSADGTRDPNGGQFSAIRAWLGESGLTEISRTPSIDENLPMEDEELDTQQQEEPDNAEELVMGFHDRDNPDALSGDYVPFRRKLTGNAIHIDPAQIRNNLKKCSNLFQIEPAKRGAMYKFWEQTIMRQISRKAREALKEYETAALNWKSTKYMANIRLIRHLGCKVIACTTTGLSKYRALLSALKPHTLLIEEAAETLESHVVAGQLDSLEQLILVGDHKQLQARANVQALEEAPFNLNISMFERLVMNGIRYTMLNKQRRMIPAIRKLLTIPNKGFYKDLFDHPSVLDRVNRPPIPGMGNRALYFFSHTWPETRNQERSWVNVDEAEFVAGVFRHMVLNGTDASKITVLTFYNGQRKLLIKWLKHYMRDFQDIRYFNVFTVDSYQGEENDIILLSLVRSNEQLKIGFLESQNRLVVALSRARRGFYLFGNAVTLMGNEDSTDYNQGRPQLYTPLLTYMKSQNQLDIKKGFPITCMNHGDTVYFEEPDSWEASDGGCFRKCDKIMACGHPCSANCHTISHEVLMCKAPCRRVLDCGHGCSMECGMECRCSECTEPAEALRKSVSSNRDIRVQSLPEQPSSDIAGIRPTSNAQFPSTSGWKEYAEKEKHREFEEQPPIDMCMPVIKDKYIKATTNQQGVRTTTRAALDQNEGSRTQEDKIAHRTAFKMKVFRAPTSISPTTLTPVVAKKTLSSQTDTPPGEVIPNAQEENVTTSFLDTLGTKSADMLGVSVEVPSAETEWSSLPAKHDPESEMNLIDFGIEDLLLGEQSMFPVEGSTSVETESYDLIQLD